LFNCDKLSVNYYINGLYVDYSWTAVRDVFYKLHFWENCFIFLSIKLLEYIGYYMAKGMG